MKYRRLFITMQVFVYLSYSTERVIAYGNLTYTINCPTFRLVGTTDTPHYNATAGLYYVMGDGLFRQYDDWFRRYG